MVGWEELDVLHSPLLSLSVVDFEAAVEDGGAFEDDGGAGTVLGIFAAKIPIKSCSLLLDRLVATDVVVGRFSHWWFLWRFLLSSAQVSLQKPLEGKHCTFCISMHEGNKMNTFRA
jgi:hypothetical protein